MLRATRQEATADLVTSLYCLVCSSLVRKPVSLPCCGDSSKTYCCASCVREGDLCPLCGVAVGSDAVRYARDVGEASDRVPCRCPNEGCEVMLPSHEIKQHATGACPHLIIRCAHWDDGCTYECPRRSMGDHLYNDCMYRSVVCPKRCGASVVVQELNAHMEDVCLKTLLHCPNGCGQEVERGLMSDHESVCPVRPLSCPYARYGCDLRGQLSREQLGQHMASSIHAHLLLIDAYTSAQSSKVAAALSAVTRRPLHVWDPGYILVVERWPAQEATIRAITILGGWLVAGCDRGSLLVLDVNTGARIKYLEGVGTAPITSICATSDGRLVVAFSDCTVQVWESADSEPLVRKSLTQRLYLSRRISSRPSLSLALVGMSKQKHVGPSRRHLLHSELYAVPPMTPTSEFDGNILDCLAVGCGGEVFILTLSTLEQVVRLSVTDLIEEAGSEVLVAAVAVVGPSNGGSPEQLLIGLTSGQLIAVDLASKNLNHRVLAQPFPNGESVSAIWVGLSSGSVPTTRVALGGGVGSVAIFAITNNGSDLERLLYVERGHRGAVRSICSPDGKHFVSGSEDETTMVWSLDHQLPIREMPNSLYCAVTAHQLVFGAGTQGNIKVLTSTTCRTEK
jgi:WD40 repeat protein